MNPTLQQCREYYNRLPQHFHTRATVKHMLAAIEIAEQLQDALAISRELRTLDALELEKLKERLAIITKPEGE